MFTHAITRIPGPDFAAGITTSVLGKPDYTCMLKQHQVYVEVLSALGLEVLVLDPLPGLPDAYFVEDPAVVVPEVGVITSPGALARRGEEQALAPVLENLFPKTVRIILPATLEGGDVMMVERHFFIGLTERTNRAGAQQLGTALEAAGYTWEAVPVQAGLHLKSSVAYVGKNTILVTEALAGYGGFTRYEKILVDPSEEYAANTLLVNNHLLTPTGFPDTHKKLSGLGFEIIEVDVSEARKMDGGLSCMSLRY